MPTIKGPIIIKKGENIMQIADKIGTGNISLPFKATGWKSERNKEYVKE